MCTFGSINKGPSKREERIGNSQEHLALGSVSRSNCKGSSPVGTREVMRPPVVWAHRLG